MRRRVYLETTVVSYLTARPSRSVITAAHQQPRLALTEDALRLASEFVQRRLLPEKAAEDGLHIAVATIHDVDYLMTWNCTHIANPEIQERLAQFLFGVMPYHLSVRLKSCLEVPCERGSCHPRSPPDSPRACGAVRLRPEGDLR